MKIEIKEEMKQELPESGNMQTTEIKIEDCEEVPISQIQATAR
jgi:hypothetical protein